MYRSIHPSLGIKDVSLQAGRGFGGALRILLDEGGKKIRSKFFWIQMKDFFLESS